MNKIFKILIILFSLSSMAKMSPTKVGNGDDGADLEGFVKIKKGKILSSRKLAVEKVKKMNVSSIRALGTLESEVAKTDLYMTKKNITDSELLEMGAFETDRMGHVYARTFARPHAATRFFPIAKTLDNTQLVALHIHEALHRSLPESVRENEEIVSKITLALVSPSSSFDNIESTVNKYVPKEVNRRAGENWGPKSLYLEGDQLKRNIFDYEAMAFSKEGSSSLDEVNTTHRISSKLYPFGGSMTGIGLGLALSWVSINDRNEMGPLSISFQKQINTITRFKVFGFLEHSIAGDSSEISKSSFSRDVTRLGLQMYSFKNKNINLINTLKMSLPSQALDSSLGTEVKYDYGTQYNANVKLRGIYKGFGLGSFFDYAIATEREVTNGNFKTTEPRESVVSLGFEAGYFKDNFSVILSTQKIMNKKDSIDFSRFGDLDQYGVGNSNVKLGVSLLW